MIHIYTQTDTEQTKTTKLPDNEQRLSVTVLVSHATLQHTPHTK